MVKKRGGRLCALLSLKLQKNRGDDGLCVLCGKEMKGGVVQRG